MRFLLASQKRKFKREPRPETDSGLSAFKGRITLLIFDRPKGHVCKGSRTMSASELTYVVFLDDPVACQALTELESVERPKVRKAARLVGGEKPPAGSVIIRHRPKQTPYVDVVPASSGSYHVYVRESDTPENLGKQKKAVRRIPNMVENYDTDRVMR